MAQLVTLNKLLLEWDLDLSSIVAQVSDFYLSEIKIYVAPKKIVRGSYQ